MVLASHLATIGYRVALRTAVGGGAGQNCFRNLCYQFLLISDNSCTVEYVVDPNFRSALLCKQALESGLSPFRFTCCPSSPPCHILLPKGGYLLCREQFAISQSTPEYEKLLSLVPGEFVGTTARLRPLVKLLCLQMEQAFQDTGLTRPPWRQAESMMSKWLPSKAGLLTPAPCSPHSKRKALHNLDRT